MTIIGSASIQIRAIDDFFRKDVEDAVKKIQDLKIKVTAQFDDVETKKKLDELQAQLDENPLKVKVKASTEEASAALDEMYAKYRNQQVDFNVGGSVSDSGATAQLDEVAAAAERINALHPTVHVSADTAAVDSALAAVQAAQLKLDNAQRAAANSASVQYIAELRLEDVQSRRSVTELQLASAEEALERATRNATAAEVADLTANQALNTARATAATRMAEEQRAQELLRTGQAASAVATDKLSSAKRTLQIAEQNLAKVMADSASTDKQKLAAENALASAARQVESAEASLAAAIEKTDQAGKSSLSRWQLIALAIVALLPPAVPVAAMAVGLGASFVALGATAVLAFKGISAEMANTTEVGLKYRDELGVLKDDMGALEHTAASGLITPFTDAVSKINAAMPTLNSEVGIFSGTLGGILSSAVDGIIHALADMEPLLISSAGYIKGLVDAFDGYTTGGGLQSFAAYALSVLPSVEGMLNQLVAAAFHLLAALAPIGQVGVGFITALSWAINAIPVQVLSVLIGSLSTALLVLKTWGAVTPLITGFGDAWSYVTSKFAGTTAAITGTTVAEEALAVATESANVAAETSGASLEIAAAGADTATVALDATAVSAEAAGTAFDLALGPIGWVIAGVSALAVGFLTATASTKTNIDSVNDYTAALKLDNGVIGDNIKLQAAKAMSSQQLSDASKQLGISTQTLTNAALGQPDAIKAVNDALNAAQKQYDDGSVSVDNFGRATSVMTDKQEQLKNAHDAVAGAVKGATDGINAATDANKREATANGQSAQEVAIHAAALNNIKDAYNTANTSQNTYLKALDAYSKSTGTAADKATFIGATLKASQGDALGYVGAMAAATKANQTLITSFDQEAASVKSGQTAFKDTEKAAIDLKTGIIDFNAAGAAPLVTNLQSMQDAAVAAASALYQHEVASKGAGQAAADAADIFKTDTYDALIKDAGQLGLTADQASKLADQYFAMPKDIKTQVMTIGEQTVVKTLDEIGQQLSKLTGMPWTSVMTADNQTGPGAAAAAATVAGAATPVTVPITASNQTSGGVAAAKSAVEAATLPKSVRLDANTDSIKPKLDNLGRQLDEEMAKKHQAQIDIKTKDAQAAIDMIQAHIDGLQQKKEADLKVGTVSALNDASNLQRQIDDLKQQKAVDLMVNPDPAIASTTSIQDHMDELKQKNQPKILADPTPAWERIQQTQDSIDVLKQKHLIPIMVSPDINAVANFQGEIDALHGKTIVINTDYTTNGQDTGIPNTTNAPWGRGNAIRNLNGGILDGFGVRAFADGGLLQSLLGAKRFANGSENHVAQIARGGYPYRVWAEPETEGEAYIPLAQSKRGRSENILSVVAEKFGFGLVKKFADGGLNGGSTTGSASPIQRLATPTMIAPQVIVQPSAPLDEEKVGRIAAETLWWKMQN